MGAGRRRVVRSDPVVSANIRCLSVRRKRGAVNCNPAVTFAAMPATALPTGRTSIDRSLSLLPSACQRRTTASTSQGWSAQVAPRRRWKALTCAEGHPAAARGRIRDSVRALTDAPQIRGAQAADSGSGRGRRRDGGDVARRKGRARHVAADTSDESSDSTAVAVLRRTPRVKAGIAACPTRSAVVRHAERPAWPSGCGAVMDAV